MAYRTVQTDPYAWTWHGHGTCMARLCINGPINGPFSNTGDVEQAARQRTGRGEESH